MPVPDSYGRIRAEESHLEVARAVKKTSNKTWNEFFYGAIKIVIEEYMDKDDLYEIAVELDIDGRGEMNEEELQEAILNAMG